VWEALTDWSNAHMWMPGIEGMTAAGETAVGTNLTFRARGADRSSAIVHCDAGRSIVLRSTQGRVTADYRYEVHELGENSTRVTLVADCKVTGLGMKLLSPLLRIAIKMSDGKQLKLLRALVESS
jgi:carbon monoxide dehydrogenase subunit G